MKITKAIIKLITISSILLYIAGSIASASFKLYMWTITTRAVVAIFWTIVSFAIIVMVVDTSEAVKKVKK